MGGKRFVSYKPLEYTVKKVSCMISGFCHSINGNFILQGCYMAHIGSLVTDISGQPISSIFKDQAVQEDP
jgi:hypothetical protein